MGAHVTSIDIRNANACLGIKNHPGGRASSAGRILRSSPACLASFLVGFVFSGCEMPAVESMGKVSAKSGQQLREPIHSLQPVRISGQEDSVHLAPPNTLIPTVDDGPSACSAAFVKVSEMFNNIPLGFFPVAYHFLPEEAGARRCRELKAALTSSERSAEDPGRQRERATNLVNAWTTWPLPMESEMPPFVRQYFATVARPHIHLGYHSLCHLTGAGLLSFQRTVGAVRRLELITAAHLLNQANNGTAQMVKVFRTPGDAWTDPQHEVGVDAWNAALRDQLGDTLAGPLSWTAPLKGSDDFRCLATEGETVETCAAEYVKAHRVARDRGVSTVAVFHEGSNNLRLFIEVLRQMRDESQRQQVAGDGCIRVLPLPCAATSVCEYGSGRCLEDYVPTEVLPSVDTYPDAHDAFSHAQGRLFGGRTPAEFDQCFDPPVNPGAP